MRKQNLSIGWALFVDMGSFCYNNESCVQKSYANSKMYHTKNSWRSWIKCFVSIFLGKLLLINFPTWICLIKSYLLYDVWYRHEDAIDICWDYSFWEGVGRCSSKWLKHNEYYSQTHPVMCNNVNHSGCVEPWKKQAIKPIDSKPSFLTCCFHKYPQYCLNMINETHAANTR